MLKITNISGEALDCPWLAELQHLYSRIVEPGETVDVDDEALRDLYGHDPVLPEAHWKVEEPTTIKKAAKAAESKE